MPIDKFRHPKTGVAGWRVRVSRTVNGKRERRQRFVFASIAVAREVEKELREDVEAAAHGVKGATAAATIDDVITAYLAHAQAKKKKTWADDAWRLRNVADFLGHRTAVHALKVSSIVEYQQHRLAQTAKHGRPIRPATVNREVSIFGTALTYAGIERIVEPPHNPVAYIDHLTEASVRPFVISDDQIVAICAGSEGHVRLAALISRLTGLRQSHVTGLRWDQIVDVRDADGAVVGHMIYPREALVSNNKRMGRVPVRPGLWKALGERRGSGPIVAYHGKEIAKATEAFSRGLERAGLKGVFSFKDLRMAFSMEAVRAGVDPAMREIMMGHGADFHVAKKVQHHYLAIDDIDLLREAEKLPDCDDLVDRVLNAAPPKRGRRSGKRRSNEI